MTGRLTKPQRELLIELRDWTLFDVALRRGERRILNSLTAAKFAKYLPETTNLRGAWKITPAGRAALSEEKKP